MAAVPRRWARPLALLVACGLAGLVLGRAFAAVRPVEPPALTVRTVNGVVDLEGIGPSNPIVLDVPHCGTSAACTYVIAKAAQGRADLRGVIASGPVEQVAGHLALLRDYGLTRVPEATPGAQAPLSRPASGEPADTAFTPTPGSDLIVAEARRANPEQPLLVLSPAPGTTAATAYLTDPAIADSMVVALTGEGDDEWAVEVLRRGVRTVLADPPGDPAVDGDTGARIERELPPGALRDALLGTPAIAGGDVVGDAAFALYLHRPYTWRAVEPRDGLLTLTAFDVPEATSEWFATLTDPALHGGRPLDPPLAPVAAAPEPEPSAAPAFRASIDFGPAGAPPVDGYRPDSGAVFGDRGGGLSYGWDADVSDHMRQRNQLEDARYDTLAHFSKDGDRTWEIAVPAGTYEVRLVLGDPQHTDQLNRLDVEGAIVEDAEQDHFDAATVTVEVSDGRLTLRPAAGASNAKICLIKISQR